MRSTCFIIYLLTAVLAFGFPESSLGQPGPKPGPKPKPGPASRPAPPPGPAPRIKHLATLKATRVNLSFPKATMNEVLEGLRRASGLKIRIGKKATKLLEKRKFKIKYIVSARRGTQVLADLVKAAAVDYLVSDEGVLVDTKAVIKRLKKKLGISTKPTRLSAKDVEKALTTKELSLSSNKKSLTTFLRFMREETGVPFVRLSIGKAKEPLISLSVAEEPFKSVLDRALHPVGYDWVRQGRVILVGPKAEIAAQKKPKPKAP